MTQKIILIFLLAVVTTLSASLREVSADLLQKNFSFSKNACTDLEEWSLSEQIPKKWREEFKNTLLSEYSLALSLSESLGFQKLARSPEASLFGAYWKNRSLFRAGLFHTAMQGMAWILTQAHQESTIGIQIAALDCLNRIQSKHPRLYFGEDVAKNLPKIYQTLKKYYWESHSREVFYLAAGNWLRVQISDPDLKKSSSKTLQLLKGAGAHYWLASGLYYSHLKNYKRAISSYRRFFKTTPMPESLNRYRNGAQISLSRAYYKTDRYDRSAVEFKKVGKDSNELVRVLTELSWVYFMEKKFGESVGTSIDLQKGGFRNTFAPEAIMVMSMALNELCQYPASLRSVRYFRRHYKDSYEWLKNWYITSKKNISEKKDAIQDLYQVITDFIKYEKKPKDIPKNVLTEWMRSPVFLTHQEELNLVLDEKKVLIDLIKLQREKYRDLRKQVKESTEEINEEIREAKEKKISPRQYPEELKLKIAGAKWNLAQLKRLKTLSETLKRYTLNYRRQAPGIARNLVRRINVDLASLNIRMLKRLKELAENFYLLEVEIYNGASEDVVWQNAHPEYKEFAEDLKSKAQGDPSKILNWGKAQIAGNDEAEIWEDELGALKAGLTNNCSNKDKYLALVLEENRKKE